MGALILEFRPIMAYLKNPYLKNVRYFFRFSSIDTIENLNKLDKTLMGTQSEWIISFGRKDGDHIVPHELLVEYDVINSSIVSQLEKDWRNSLKFNESVEARFELIDNFINQYGLSSALILNYYTDIL